MGERPRRVKHKAKSGAGPRARPRNLSKARLEAMAEEATVDAHDESEQATGWFTMFEEHLDLPFDTKVLGVDVTVEMVDLSDHDDVIVVCRRGKERQSLPILDLPLPSPPPSGWEWIEAYRHWARGWR